jgi:uncharacterized phage infection (PIP) family protein YhgE
MSQQGNNAFGALENLVSSIAQVAGQSESFFNDLLSKLPPEEQITYAKQLADAKKQFNDALPQLNSELKSFKDIMKSI